MNPLLAALAYAARGWFVFPVWGVTLGGKCVCPRGRHCDRPGKHPATEHGLTDATVDREVISSWWRQAASHNIGIACRQSGLIAIDIDPRHGGDESWSDLRQRLGEGITDTTIAITGGGGYHVIYTAPAGETLGDVACSDRYVGPLGPGIDVRAQGYIVAPPSRHASGVYYEWEDDRTPADLPLGLFELLKPLTSAGSSKAMTTRDILAGLPEGTRDWQLFLLASRLRGAGVPVDMAYRLIEDAAAACSPAFPIREARAKVDSAYGRYPEGKVAVQRIDPATGEIERLFIWANELDNLPALKWLVEGIAPTGALGALIGPYGSYKTFLALDMAACIATGKDWHGRDTRQGYVVYVYAEGVRGLSRRVRAWEHAHNQTVTNIAFVPRAVQLLQPEDVEFLCNRIRAEMPEMPVMIVIDTLARGMAGGDENKQQDMGVLVDSADRLARETGAFVLLIHHTNKLGEYRGSTSLPGALDVMVLVEKGAGNAVKLVCEKSKDAEPFESINLVLSPHCESLAVETAGTYTMMKTTIEQLKDRDRAILGALDDTGASWGDWRNAAGNPHKTTFSSVVKSLLAAGIVVRQGQNYVSLVQMGTEGLVQAGTRLVQAGSESAVQGGTWASVRPGDRLVQVGTKPPPYVVGGALTCTDAPPCTEEEESYEDPTLA